MTAVSANFSDFAGPSCEFSSCWQKSQDKSESSTQCSLFESSEEEAQTDVGVDQGIQTDPVDISANVQSVDYDPASMSSFLSTVVPYVEKQIFKNLDSHAFDNYQPYIDLESQYTVSLQHELSCTKAEASVTSVAWNCTGSVLAVAYGRFDHTGWCVHNGLLCTWSVFRRNMDPTRPDLELDTGGCVQSVTFHPTLPTILALGTYHGALMVWDTEKSEELIVAPTSEHSHSEPITKISWIPGANSLASQIVTIGGDGKVLLWTLSRKSESSTPQIELVRGFSLMNKRGGESTVAGGTAMSFSTANQIKNHHQPDYNVFVVGTESGRVYKCAIPNQTQQQLITMSFTPHAGPVQALDFSPSHKDLFLSCSTDSCVRIYHLLRAKPLVTITPSEGYLFGVAWSLVRPLVFAVASDDGNVYIYDLLHNRAKPAVALRVDTTINRAAVYSFAFNPQISDFIATGDSRGIVKVWQLSQFLSREQQGEKMILNKLGEAR